MDWNKMIRFAKNAMEVAAYEKVEVSGKLSDGTCYDGFHWKQQQPNKSGDGK